MEILLSESSVITTYYFGWSTSSVAIFLACLGLTVLPVNILVGSYISNMFEDRYFSLEEYFQSSLFYDHLYLLVESSVNISPAHWWICSCWPNCRQILLASEILVFIGIVMSFHIIIPYSVAQYVVSGLVMFVSAEVLEGDIFYLIQFIFRLFLYFKLLIFN